MNTLYITHSLNAKPTEQIHVPIILATNTIHSAEEGERRPSELCYGQTTGHGEKRPDDNPLCPLLMPDDQFCAVFFFYFIFSPVSRNCTQTKFSSKILLTRGSFPYFAPIANKCTSPPVLYAHKTFPSNGERRPGVDESFIPKINWSLAIKRRESTSRLELREELSCRQCHSVK